MCASKEKDCVCYLKRSPGFQQLNKNLYLIHRWVGVAMWGGCAVNQAGYLPLAPLAPVLRCEVKAFWIYAQVSLLHRSFVSIHNVLWKCQDVLTLHGTDKTKPSSLKLFFFPVLCDRLSTIEVWKRKLGAANGCHIQVQPRKHFEWCIYSYNTCKRGQINCKVYQ